MRLFFMPEQYFPFFHIFPEQRIRKKQQECLTFGINFPIFPIFPIFRGLERCVLNLFFFPFLNVRKNFFVRKVLEKMFFRPKPFCAGYEKTRRTLRVLFGAPRRIRIPSLLIRSQMLYPVELWALKQERIYAHQKADASVFFKKFAFLIKILAKAQDVGTFNRYPHFKTKRKKKIAQFSYS